MNFTVPDLRHGYVDVVQAVVANGQQTTPRNPTVELLGVTITVDDPQDTLPVGVGRKASPKLAAIEALQLVGGYSDVEQAKRVSPHLGHFEDLGRFHGAYGPRVFPQLVMATRRLAQDPHSRRAVINVWDPVQDLLVDGVKNYPCTTQLQFMLREGQLHMFVTMRANDAWKGLAYDAFTFAQLQFTVAHALGVPVGQYHHYATSLHVYADDLAKVPTLTKEYGGPKPATGFGEQRLDWPRVRHDPELLAHRLLLAVDRAQEIGAGKVPAYPTRSEQWYMDTLSGML